MYMVYVKSKKMRSKKMRSKKRRVRKTRRIRGGTNAVTANVTRTNSCNVAQGIAAGANATRTNSGNAANSRNPQ